MGALGDHAPSPLATSEAPHETPASSWGPSVTTHPFLSQRLLAVADAVPPGRPMADIGTDHALVPVWLRLHDRVPWAVAGDRAIGPLRAAAQTVARYGATEIALRHGDGLHVLVPGEVATVAIAGMGAHRIVGLLDRAPDHVHRLERLVLQPNSEWAWCRRTIMERGWSLVDETLTAEGGHFFLTLAIDPTCRPSQEDVTDLDFELGPWLRRRRTPTFDAWIATQVRDLDHTLAQLPESVHADHPRRLALRERRALFVAALEAADPCVT